MSAQVKDRWEHSSEVVDCQHCWGSGQDDSEVDGDCLYCRGKGEYEVHRSFCTDCGCESDSCDCDDPTLERSRC